MKQTNPDLTPLYHDLIKNVVSHEASHMAHLAFQSGTDTTQHHWIAAPNLGTLMEQFIGTKATMDKKGNIVITLYISNSYAGPDTQQPGGDALK